MSEYHEPVLLQKCIDYLNIKPDGVYVDATFGGGGHSKKILNNLGDNGRLIAFDQDADALKNLTDDHRLIFCQHNFRHLKRFLRVHGYKKVDGILADLGVSSHQLNEAERGFSYRFEADLDMRMNQYEEKTAADLLNTLEPNDLQAIFGKYGEVRNSKTLAFAIADARVMKPFQTIGDLLSVLNPLVRGKRNRYLAQVFQALRIEVNDEMGALEEFLGATIDSLNIGGRLVVMSYHSLEDRLVKNFLKKGNAEGKFIKDFYGNIYRPFKEISKKAIEASPEEIKENSRARSVKLRVGELQETITLNKA